MRTFILLLLCAFLSPAVGAAVYKWYDAEGNVHFGDSPREGAEEVHVPPPQTYQPAPLPAFTPSPAEPEKPPAYVRFELIAPADEATVRDNTGAMTVSFALDPALKPGHKIRVLMDGEVKASSKSVTINLDNVDRGTHTLQGQVVDSRGKVQTASATITIHMHRQVAPKPAPAPNPPPAKK